MPLSTPCARELIHARAISCQGFRRLDGLWEVEGHITDHRAFDHVSIWDCENISAETPVHEMWLRLTLDGEMTILAVETSMDHTPCPPHCAEVQPKYQQLKGMKITAGFRKRAYELIGGTSGCTHVTSLLQSMATTAFQTIESAKLRAIPGVSGYSREMVMVDFSDPSRPDRFLQPQTNGCHTYSEQGPVINALWPHLRKDPAADKES